MVDRTGDGYLEEERVCRGGGHPGWPPFALQCANLPRHVQHGIERSLHFPPYRVDEARIAPAGDVRDDVDEVFTWRTQSSAGLSVRRRGTSVSESCGAAVHRLASRSAITRSWVRVGCAAHSLVVPSNACLLWSLSGPFQRMSTVPMVENIPPRLYNFRKRLVRLKHWEQNESQTLN